MSHSLFRSAAVASLLAVFALSSVAVAAVDEPSQLHAPAETREEGVVNPSGIEHAGAEAHDDHHGDHHVPTWSDVNWFHGFLGEKEGVEPSLLWRPVGMPVPVGVLLLNTAVLVWIFVRFFGPAVSSGLVQRKKRIAGEIEAAAKMKKEAEEQLSYYETKLAETAAEMDRIKKEMREQSEAERERMLAEARERRDAMENEARHIVEQELAHARQEAIHAAVRAAVSAARSQISSRLDSAQQEQLAERLVVEVKDRLPREVRS